MASHSDLTEEDLLQELSKEELEELSDLIDPDVSERIHDMHECKVVLVLKYCTQKSW